MLFTRDHPVYTPALMRPLARWPTPAWSPPEYIRLAMDDLGAARSTTASGAWRTLVRSLREEQVRLTV
jgi:hypothetical protein